VYTRSFASLSIRSLWLGCAHCGPPPKGPTVSVADCEGGCTIRAITLAPTEAGLISVSRCDAAHRGCQERNQALLTALGRQRLSELAAELATVELPAELGCAGCADGPVRSLSIPALNRRAGTRRASPGG
jgi:hypothetical protein